MRSLLLDVFRAFDNVYSGWILWNLFLAFVPLLLSFHLFRPKAIPQSWRWPLYGGLGLVGVAGLIPRTGRILAGWNWLLEYTLTGKESILLRLGWLALAAGFAAILGLWGLKPRRPAQAWLWGIGVVVFMVFLPNAPYVLTDIIHLIRGARVPQIPIWVIALVFIPVHLTAIVLGFQAYVISILNLAYYLKQQGAKALILPTELLIHALSAIGIYLGRFIRFNSWDLVTDPLDVVANTLNVLTSRRPLAVVFVTFIILTVSYWVMKQVTLGLKLRIAYARKGLDALD